MFPLSAVGEVRVSGRVDTREIIDAVGDALQVFRPRMLEVESDRVSFTGRQVLTLGSNPLSVLSRGVVTVRPGVPDSMIRYELNFTFMAAVRTALLVWLCAMTPKTIGLLPGLIVVPLAWLWFVGAAYTNGCRRFHSLMSSVAARLERIPSS